MTVSNLRPDSRFFTENGIIQKENDSLLGSLGRWFKVQTSGRSYDILTILRQAINSKANNLAKEDFDFICCKSAKKLNIPDNILRSFINFSNLEVEQMNASIATVSESISGDGKIDQSKKCSEIKALNQFAKKSGLKNPQITELLEKAYQKVKLKAVGLDPSLADTCFEDVKLLFDTRLIYSILGLQNSTSEGKIKHRLDVHDNGDGTFELMILKEGRFQSIKDIKKLLEFDKKEGMLCSRGNTDERWNYLNNGLVAVDRFFHHDRSHLENYPVQNQYLHEVTQLSALEMSKLLAHAQKGVAEEDSSKQDRSAVVQFITHPRFSNESNLLLNNLDAQVPVHCGIRVITNDGKVYSTGFGSTLDEDKFNTGLDKYLATINGQPTNIDYEEFRAHEGRITTSLAVTQENAEKILEQLNSYRREGIRFNILKQNCMRLGTNVLSMAGTELDIRVSLDTTLLRCLPDSKNIPVFGSLLSKTFKVISSISDLIDKKTPQVVKDIFKDIKDCAFYIPRKLGTIVKNILVYSLGGVVASPQFSKSLSNNELNQDSLESFNCLLSSIFDDEASDIHHSSVFINWQLSQATTQIHEYTGPSMSLLPLEDEETKARSEVRKKTLQEMYKYSTPERV